MKKDNVDGERGCEFKLFGLFVASATQDDKDHARRLSDETLFFYFLFQDNQSRDAQMMVFASPTAHTDSIANSISMR